MSLPPLKKPKPPSRRHKDVDQGETLRAGDREVYVVQLRDIRSKLKIVTDRIRAVEEENERLTLELADLEEAKARQYQEWDNLKNHQEHMNAEHARRIEELDQEKLDEVAKLVADIERTKNETAEQLVDFEAQVLTLRKKIHRRETFMAFQDHILLEIYEVDNQRRRAGQEFDARTKDNDASAADAKKKLEQRFTAKLDHLTQRMKSLSDSLMAETTKRTIIENLRLAKLIDDMEQSNKDLRDKNEDCLVEAHTLRRRNEMLVASEQHLAKNLRSAKIVQDKLDEKIKEMERRRVVDGNLEAEVEQKILSLQEALLDKEARLNHVQGEVEDLEMETDAEASQAQHIRQELRDTLSSLDDAARFLLSCTQNGGNEDDAVHGDDDDVYGAYTTEEKDAALLFMLDRMERSRVLPREYLQALSKGMSTEAIDDLQPLQESMFSAGIPSARAPSSSRMVDATQQTDDEVTRFAEQLMADGELIPSRRQPWQLG